MHAPSLAAPELRVDLDALAANARAFRSRSRGLVAVVKADAFGHGDVAAHLLANGADWLGTTSLEEAVEWAKRCPSDPQYGSTQVLEIRPVFEPEDFGAEYTPELRELDERLAEEIKAQHGGA